MKCCDINAGDLRTEIVIQDENPTSDGAGGQTVAFMTVSTTFSKVVSKKGYEDFKLERRRPIARYQMTLRYDSRINEKMRVAWKGKTGNITDVDNLEERDQWLILTVEEGIGE